MIHLEVLVEEPSAEKALSCIMPKLTQVKHDEVRTKIINMGSKSKLLKRLPERLRGYYKRIHLGENLRIIILVDRDQDDCSKLKQQLECIAYDARLSTKTRPDTQGNFAVVTRIVVKELECWFLGDPKALRKAFSSLPTKGENNKIFLYPDKNGSWKTLHRFLRKNGIYTGTFPKIEAAERIGPHLEASRNSSVSFKAFVAGVQACIGE